MKRPLRFFIIVLNIIFLCISLSIQNVTVSQHIVRQTNLSISTELSAKALEEQEEAFDTNMRTYAAKFSDTILQDPELSKKNESKIINNVNKEILSEISIEKKEIPVYIYGELRAKNKLAILGSIHGDEPQGKYIVEKLMEHIDNYPDIIENKQILFIPVINPDGLSRGTRGNANMVDINRNFPTNNWGLPADTNSRYNPGTKAGSEPETQILLKYIDKVRPELIIIIHSPLKVINYDGKNSKRIADLLQKNNNYQIVEDIGYPTPGSLGTYYGKERDIPVITLETGNDSVEKAWAENMNGLLEVIQLLDFE